MHIKRTGMSRNARERMGKTNNVQQRPSQIPDKYTNESLGRILIINAELLDRTYLPSAVVVAYVLLFVLFFICICFD